MLFFSTFGRQITRAQGNEEAAKINAQREAEARIRQAEIEAQADR